MQLPRYKIADVIFDVRPMYKYSVMLCENYLYSGDCEPEFSVVMKQSDIDAEKTYEGAAGFPDYYLESLALFRKLCEYILTNKQGIIFHCSAVAVDGKAYLFTAPSGTGKSTHTRLWKEMLGDRMIYINDDKPIIRYVDGDFYVYGTPWNGKHRLDTNTRAKIAAICILKRGKENSIEKVTPQEMLMTVMAQTLRPTNVEDADKFIEIIDKMLKKVSLYKLYCNMSPEAARVSYGAMSGENLKDDRE